MKVVYLIEGQRVQKSIFRETLCNQVVFDAWEKVINENKLEIEASQAALIFKIIDKEFHVITDTTLLFKLTHELNKNLVYELNKI